MKLQMISVAGDAGLKGWTGDARLSGVDVFAGPNGAGKSTRLLAVLACLRGLAETPTDSVREYLGPALPAATVDLTFDNLRLSRSLSDGGRTAAAKKADALTEQLVGGHVVRWDLADFASSTPANRQVLLDRVCDLAAAGWTPTRLVDELQVALAPRRNAAPEEGEEQPTPAVPPMLADLTRRHRPEGRTDAWLAKAEEWARAAYTDANALKRSKAVEAEALLAEPADDEVASPAQLTAQVEALQARRRAIEGEIRDAKSSRDRARAEASRRAAAERVAAERRAELERVERELAGLPSSGTVADEKARTDEAYRTTELARRADRDARDALSDAQAELARARAMVDARADALSGPCKHCGHTDPLGLTDALRAAEAERDQAAEAVDDAELEVAAAAGEVRAATEAETAARAALEVARRRSELTRRAAELRSVVDEVVEGDVQLIEPPSLEEVERLEAGLAEVLGQIRALTQRRDRAVRASERERLIQRAIADRDEAIDRFEQVVALGKAIKALRSRLVESAFAPIETEASGIVGPVLGGRVVFRSGADFGLERHGEYGVYVPWWSLSDGERAVVGAGISYAFARLGRAPWRAVILDGAEAVDGDRLSTLLAQLAARVRVGDLDNVLVALRADERPEVPSGVTVHWLEGQPAAAAA